MSVSIDLSTVCACLLVGAAVLVPMILAYSGYAYWVFRRKVQHDAGYH